MSQEEQQHLEQDEARIVMRRHRTSVGLAVTAAVLLLIGWLVYGREGEKSAIAYVRFANAEGVEPGKTEVRCLGLKVGIVEKADYSADLHSVVLALRIDPLQKKLLRHDSRFWIEPARAPEPDSKDLVQAINGLATLIQGSYIVLKPGAETALADHFEGLEQPPATVTSDTPQPKPE